MKVTQMNMIHKAMVPLRGSVKRYEEERENINEAPRFSLLSSYQTISTQTLFPQIVSTQTIAQDGSPGNAPGGETDEETLIEVQLPSLYKVILLNDDFTPMDFVIKVLKSFFGKPDPDAHQIMMEVHQQGSGIAGIYSYEVAEMKSMQVNRFSQQNQYPLKTIIEEE